jgi:hypothetical protein
MSEQLPLIETRPNLTERQEYALQLIEQHPTAAPDWWIGHCVHVQFGKHSEYRECDWCASTGRELGRALRNKKLVKESRKLGGWVLANRGRHTAHGASGPGELPEDY